MIIRKRIAGWRGWRLRSFARRNIKAISIFLRGLSLEDDGGWCEFFDCRAAEQVACGNTTTRRGLGLGVLHGFFLGMKNLGVDVDVVGEEVVRWEELACCPSSFYIGL